MLLIGGDGDRTLCHLAFVNWSMEVDSIEHVSEKHVRKEDDYAHRGQILFHVKSPK
jgi:hypothetical protein